MKLPTQKKILREDLKDAPPWAGVLIDTLNSFMESVYQALNRNITFTENIASFVKEITYKTPASYPADVINVTFQNTLKTKPIGVQVIQVYDTSNYVPAEGPVYVPWVETNGSIVISTITGLDPSKTYNIRLLIF